MINFLYCGMSTDVLLPYLLVEDVGVLYSICLHGRAGSLRIVNKAIKRILNKLYSGVDEIERLKLKEPCKNITVKTTGKHEKLRYQIQFEYLEKKRKIIYYINRNFLIEWPDEIKDISHLASIGAVFEYLDPTLNNMLHTRCTNDCTYYTESALAPLDEFIKPEYKLGRKPICTYSLPSIRDQKEYFYKEYYSGELWE